MFVRPQRIRHRVTHKPSLWESLIDPIDGLSETIFSILILLTFTLAYRIFVLSDGSSSALTSGEMNDLLIGAVGAIFAWGVIDGVMYALISLFERGERHRLLKNIQAAGSDEEAVDFIADDLDYILEPITEENVRKELYSSVLLHLRDSQPRRIGFTKDDFTGALGHIVVAMVSVIPSLIPLLLLRNDMMLAIRVSNIVSFIVLFIVGHRWGVYTGANPWKTGLLITAVAVLLVLIAITIRRLSLQIDIKSGGRLIAPPLFISSKFSQTDRVSWTQGNSQDKP